MSRCLWGLLYTLKPDIRTSLGAPRSRYYSDYGESTNPRKPDFDWVTIFPTGEAEVAYDCCNTRYLKNIS